MLSANFVVPPCPLCEDAPNTPTVTACGHIFCYQCLMGHIEDLATTASEEPVKCPACPNHLEKDSLFSLLAFYECWDPSRAKKYKAETGFDPQELLFAKESQEAINAEGTEDTKTKESCGELLEFTADTAPPTSHVNGSAALPIEITDARKDQPSDLDRQVTRAGGIRKTSSKVEVCLKLTQDMLTTKPDEKMIIFSRKSTGLQECRTPLMSVSIEFTTMLDVVGTRLKEVGFQFVRVSHQDFLN